MYESPAGMLYVNPGIGTFHLNVRFNCRPELTVFELGSPPYRLQDAVTAA
jgi:predicted MPP superfamily phosphohydrolase